MRGESHLPATRAIIQAKRDRRTARESKVDQAAKAPLGDVKNKNTTGDAAGGSSVDLKAVTAPNTNSNRKVVGNSASDKENTTPGAEGQANNAGTSQTKTKKKHRRWRPRRPAQGPNYFHTKAQNGEVDGT